MSGATVFSLQPSSMVSFRHVSFPFFLCLLFLIFLSPPTAGDPLYTQCGTTGDYTAKSTYESNLMNLLLPSLASNTSLSGGFLNATAGQIPDQIYGLAMCRGDTNVSVCRSCLSGAIQDAPQLCAYNKGATVIYDDCLLRYSNQRFFSTVDTSMWVFEGNHNNVTDRSRFDKIVDELMSSLTDWAVSNSTRRFATGQMVNSTKAPFPEIYGLVQCTQDLSPSQCQKCLQSILQGRPTQLEGKEGGRVITASCNYRYEIYKFFDGAATLRLEEPLENTLAPAPVMPPLINPPNEEGKSNSTIKVVLIIAISVVVAVLVVLFTICICLRRRKLFRRELLDGDEEEFRSSESLLFDLGTLRAATNNFSNANKLGEGGFGPVYKGTLLDGREIAVKRLSGSSGQGLVELRNELVLVAKLQHRNLVKLLGCCIEEQERLLVYEYLPNTSLDKFLFDPIGRQQLDWGSRYKIIEGMGRGLLYLHEDSRLRIIHRDLKPGNILLDGDMNPKISDFGLAKLFGRDETHGNTSRIAGTFGYMAPEYAFHGHFSTKSDVFSYGVLVLEIVTGRRNSGFQGSGDSLDLLGYVWQHWTEGMATQVIDQSLGNQYQAREVLRCIHIGLLCVQEDPAERPSMASVILMLSSYSVTVQPPSPPALFISSGTVTESEVFERNVRTSLSGGERSSGSTRRESRRRTGKSKPVSLNDVSITDMEPR